MYGSGVGGTFEELVRNLIDDKYNREYKLDRKTRAKAIEILKDFYAKNQAEANVSKRHRTRSLKNLNPCSTKYSLSTS